VYETGCDILFAYTSFKWANLASHNAGVTVAVVGIGAASGALRRLYKKERGRIPALDSQDAWEQRMAEGAAAFMRFKSEGRYE